MTTNSNLLFDNKLTLWVAHFLSIKMTISHLNILISPVAFPRGVIWRSYPPIQGSNFVLNTTCICHSNNIRMCIVYTEYVYLNLYIPLSQWKTSRYASHIIAVPVVYNHCDDQPVWQLTPISPTYTYSIKKYYFNFQDDNK